MTELSHDAPFGTYRLPQTREWLRQQGRLLPTGRIGQMGASLVRRVVVAGGAGPFDVEVFPTVNARLYPATNRCEKRAVTAPQFFDAEERRFIADAMARTGARADAGPFVLVDLGANVGLYGLSAVSDARRQNRDLRVVAVEADTLTRARLESNIEYSGASDVFTVVPVGVGAQAGVGVIAGHSNNRGQHKVVAQSGADGGDTFEIVALVDICRRAGVERMDVLKIDVEGHDFAVLEAFFATAPKSLWPDAVIVEIGREDGPAPAADLLTGLGYEMAQRTRLNAIVIAGAATRGRG